MLCEEDYIQALGEIIERDYFPETSIMKKHLEILTAMEKRDPILLRETQRKIVSELRRNDQTPFLNVLGTQRAASSSAQGGSRDNVEEWDEEEENDYTEESMKKMTLATFFNYFVSEDNESFAKIHQKDLENHRRKHHWVYEPQNKGVVAGLLMLYYQNGKVLSVEERERMDAILDKAYSDMYNGPDDRPTQVDTWQHRPKNQLMFPPDLDTSKNICLIPSTLAISNGDDIHLLENDVHNGRQIILANSTDGKIPSATGENVALTSCLPIQVAINDPNENPRVARGIKRQPKEVVSKNTRFKSSLVLGDVSSSLKEQPHTPSLYSDAGGNDELQFGVSFGCSTVKAENGSYKLVTMTPSPTPGCINDDDDVSVENEFMTWGSLDATPMIISAPASKSKSILDIQANYLKNIGIDVTPLAGNFEIKDVSSRERLARELDNERKRKKAQSRGNNSKTPLITVTSVGPLGITTPRRTSLTPAALNLSQKLAKNKTSNSIFNSTPLQTPKK